jgi:hypothetical protein
MANTVYGSIVIKEKGVLRTKKDNATFRLHLGHNVSEYDLWNNSFPDQIRICKLGSGLETVEILIQFRNTPSPCVIYDREIHINKKNDLLEFKEGSVFMATHPRDKTMDHFGIFLSKRIPEINELLLLLKR